MNNNHHFICVNLRNLRINHLRSSAFICGLFFSLSVHAGNNSLDVFLDGLETFSADFEQTLLDSSGEALESTKGAVRLRRPGMFYWEYREPYTQKIISDGKSLWVYEEDLEQVTISDVSDTIHDTPALIFSGDDNLADHYAIKELEKDADFTSLLLTPWNPESQYEGLYLAFYDNELSGMMVFDTLGQTLAIKFTNAQRNPPLKSEMFRFTPADNIDVIDARKSD